MVKQMTYKIYDYSKFGITPLYNADGTLQIYKEEINNKKGK